MERRDLVKALFLAPFAAPTIATAAETVLFNKNRMPVLDPIDLNNAKHLCPITIFAYAGGLLETDKGPIRLNRHEVVPLAMFPGSDITITYKLSWNRDSNNIYGLHRDPAFVMPGGNYKLV